MDSLYFEQRDASYDVAYYILLEFSVIDEKALKL